MCLVVCVCDLREADVWQRCILHHEPTFCLFLIYEELSNMAAPFGAQGQNVFQLRKYK